MGCTVSVSDGGGGVLQVGDHVQLRRGAPTSDTLSVGEVGELLELSVGGAGRVRGPRHRDKWLTAAHLQACPEPGLPPLRQAVWWWRHNMPQLKDTPGVDRNGFDQLSPADARVEEVPVREPTHYDFLAPFLPVAALHHVAARSQSLGGAWAGDSLGAVLVAQLTGISPLVEEQMSQLGETGAVRVAQLCEVLHGALVEAARGQPAAVPSCVSHIYGDRLMVCFGHPPSAAGAGGSSSALALRLAVTIVEVADLEQMDAIGKNDPFVEVKVGDRAVRTTTIDGGGSDASWGIPVADGNAGGEGGGGRGGRASGETLYFELSDSQLTDSFALRVFDADFGGQDDLIGDTALPISAPTADALGVLISGSEHSSEGWFDIHAPAQQWAGSDGRPAGARSGRVYVRVRATWIDDSDRASVAACQCARALQDCVQEWGADAGLALRCGVGSGTLQWLHLHHESESLHGVGRNVRRKAMVRGGPVAQAHLAARNARSGEICAGTSVAESASEGFRFQPCTDVAAAGKGLHVLQGRSRRVGTKAAAAAAAASSEELELELELEIPAPADIGCLQVRAKAHQGLVPYVPRLAVSFSQGDAEFRRVCVLAVQLHGYTAGDVSMRQLADLNAAFEDVRTTLEAVQTDGFISQMGYGMSPEGSDSCSLICLFGLGNSEEIAAHCEDHAVRGAVRLSELLRDKTCGSQLPVQSEGGSTATASVKCVGASIGVAAGWAWIGRLGHAVRHELGALGDVVDHALTLMADPVSSGTVLVTTQIEAKVADDFECTAVPPFALNENSLLAMGGETVFRACRERSYL